MFSSISDSITLQELLDLKENQTSLNPPNNRLSNVSFVIAQATITIIAQSVNFKGFNPDYINSLPSLESSVFKTFERVFFFVISNTARILRPIYEDYADRSISNESPMLGRLIVLIVVIVLLILSIGILYPLTKNVSKSVNQIFNLFFSIPIKTVEKVLISAENFSDVLNGSYSTIYNHFQNASFNSCDISSVTKKKAVDSSKLVRDPTKKTTAELSGLIKSILKQESEQESTSKITTENMENCDSKEEEADTLIQLKVENKEATINYKTNEGAIIKSLIIAILLIIVYFSVILLLDILYSNKSALLYEIISCYHNWNTYISWAAFTAKEAINTHTIPVQEHTYLFETYFNKSIQLYNNITIYNHKLTAFPKLESIMEQLSGNETCNLLQPDAPETCIAANNGFMSRGLMSSVFNMLTSFNDLHYMYLNDNSLIIDDSGKLGINSMAKYSDPFDIKHLYIDAGISIFSTALWQEAKGFIENREYYIFGCLFATLLMQIVLIVTLALLIIKKYRTDIIKVRQMIHILPKVVVVQFSEDINNIVSKIK